MSETDAIDVDLEEYDEYDEMLSHLDNAIEEVNYKIDNGRIRDPAKDNARVKYLRCLAYLVRSQLRVIEQRDMREYEVRLERLEEQL